MRGFKRKTGEPPAPTRMRALEIHRYVLWPRETTSPLLRVVQEAGDEIRGKDPNFVSFVIIGSRTKGTAVDEFRLKPSRYYSSDLDVLPVFRKRNRKSHALAAKIVAKHVRASARARGIRAPSLELGYPIHASDFRRKTMGIKTAIKACAVFGLATHTAINEVRHEIVRTARRQPAEFWRLVRWAHFYTNIKLDRSRLPEARSEQEYKQLDAARRHLFKLPPLQRMTKWLNRFGRTE